MGERYADDHIAFDFDLGFSKLETVLNDLCRPAFVKGKVSVIALDDDKFEAPTRQATEAGLSVKNIKKNMHPVMHVAVSLQTSLMCGVRFERLHMNTVK